MNAPRPISSRAPRVLALFALVLATFVAAPAQAYTVEGGDFLLRPVVGGSLNVLRLEAATRETPAGGLLMGLDFDYSIDGPWNVTASFRPVLSPGFVDANVGAGVKYRVVQLEAPFIPYASAMIIGAVGSPLRVGVPHLNLGARAAAGVDYFVMRNLAVGVEAAVDGSLLALPLLWGESSAEVLAGVTWRF